MVLFMNRRTMVVRDRLPPLDWLRTFEAAARHAGFTAAADELALTQASVSYHIRSLEKWLRHPLHGRSGKIDPPPVGSGRADIDPCTGNRRSLGRSVSHGGTQQSNAQENAEGRYLVGGSGIGQHRRRDCTGPEELRCAVSA